MELREFAEQILRCDDLDAKLARPTEPFTDARPGAAWRPDRPARPVGLAFAARRTAPAMPSPESLADPHRRGIAHHIMANHELQAAEVMAWMLVAFPEAPADFRAGLAEIAEEEQRHARMHVERCESLGVPFGSLPVNGWIWGQAQRFESVLDYLAGLPLTFEGRNLDHSAQFERWFRDAGDERSAAAMRTIHRDEIRHVAFGWDWLRRLKSPEQSEWDAYRTHLHWPLRPSKARGEPFDRAARLAAGLAPEFVAALESAGDEEPPDAPE